MLTGLWFAALTLLLGACSDKPQAYGEQLITFGTLVEVKIWDITPENGQRAVATLADDFEFMHRTWHAWHPGALGRVNQLLASGEKGVIIWKCPSKNLQVGVRLFL